MIVEQKSEKYGKYYGELVEFDYISHMTYSDWSERETSLFCENLEECGVTEILFDVENGENENEYSTTLYIETTDKTDYKKLMMLILSKYPDEFSEETNNHFRFWVD